MSSLSFQTDRLGQHSKSIQHAANATARLVSSSGPFTRALLHTPLGDLMRDVDATELGLFHLTPPSAESAIGLNRSNTVERVRFSAATPVKKSKDQEVQPEVYAQAALKYIDRYGNIRHMPQVNNKVQTILGRLVVLRKSVSILHDKLRQTQDADSSSPEISIESEEQKIATLQERLASLTLRKRLARDLQGQNALTSPIGAETPPAKPFYEHDDFSSVAPATKTLRFADNMLLDEDIDIGNSSVVSFGSPVLPSRVSGASYALPDTNRDKNGIHDLLPLIQPPPDEAIDSDVNEPIDLPNHEVTPKISNTTYSERIKITTDVERIVMKIWQTPSDLLLPLSNHDQTQPPSVKAFIAHLDSVSALPIPPDSPSAPSLSSATSALQSEPTVQQILTAHLLLALLSSDSYALPMNDVKDLLMSKSIAAGAAASQSPIRILFACVGKRVLKIERGRGEQMVKFDL